MKHSCLDCEIEINERLQAGKKYSFWLPLTSPAGCALSSSIPKLFQPRSPCLSSYPLPPPFFLTSFLFFVTCQLSMEFAGRRPWRLNPSIYWNIIQLCEAASMRGTWALEINIFLIGVMRCFACGAPCVFHVPISRWAHVHLPCFSCCTTWKITPG